MKLNFTDPIDAFRKGWRLKLIVNLTERSVRRCRHDSYLLIDTTLNMVIIRLGNILLHSADYNCPARGRPAAQRHQWFCDDARKRIGDAPSIEEK